LRSFTKTFLIGLIMRNSGGILKGGSWGMAMKNYWYFQQIRNLGRYKKSKSGQRAW